MKRAALYIRVSTEEQAMHGYSLAAQRESLTKYAKEHDLFIHDYYTDEGKSARKKYTSRPEFMRMLQDVEADKLDLILFIKLDRWFRSVKDYYKVQEILDAHHVSWQTTEEQYDTTTANGRLYTNIRLSLAQDEADRTSERIKFVFAAKLARKEVISGMVPLGFKIENKHLVHNPETVDMVRDLFEYYRIHNNKQRTLKYVREKYGVIIHHRVFLNMLADTRYKGIYRGIENFCEPIIDPDVFDSLQTAPTVRNNQTKRIYIFSGLVNCKECEYRMTSVYTSSHNVGYIYYRCNRYTTRRCTHKNMIPEPALEQWLLENIKSEFSRFVSDYKSKAAQREKPRIDRAVIMRKMNKLKDLYLDELIDKEAYRKDYETYAAMLAEIPAPVAPAVDIKTVQDILSGDFREKYEKSSREERRTFWRGIIKKIVVDKQNNIMVYFT